MITPWHGSYGYNALDYSCQARPAAPARALLTDFTSFLEPRFVVQPLGLLLGRYCDPGITDNRVLQSQYILICPIWLLMVLTGLPPFIRFIFCAVSLFARSPRHKLRGFEVTPVVRPRHLFGLSPH